MCSSFSFSLVASWILKASSNSACGMKYRWNCKKFNVQDCGFSLYFAVERIYKIVENNCNLQVSHMLDKIIIIGRSLNQQIQYNTILLKNYEFTRGRYVRNKKKNSHKEMLSMPKVFLFISILTFFDFFFFFCIEYVCMYVCMLMLI